MKNVIVDADFNQEYIKAFSEWLDDFAINGKIRTVRAKVIHAVITPNTTSFFVSSRMRESVLETTPTIP